MSVTVVEGVCEQAHLLAESLVLSISEAGQAAHAVLHLLHRLVRFCAAPANTRDGGNLLVKPANASSSGGPSDTYAASLPSIISSGGMRKFWRILSTKLCPFSRAFSRSSQAGVDIVSGRLAAAPSVETQTSAKPRSDASGL